MKRAIILINSFVGILIMFFGINYFIRVLLKVSSFNSQNNYLTIFIMYIFSLLISLILSTKVFNYNTYKYYKEYNKYRIFCIITSSILVGQIISFIVYKFIGSGNYEMVYKTNDLNTLNVILAFISSCILAPCSEEIFFRKIVFSILSKHNIESMTIILFSGIIFGIIHFASISSVINATIGVVCFAYAYYKTQKIVFPILGHSINNMSQYASSIVYYYKFGNNVDINYIEKYGQDINFISSIIFMAIVLIFCIMFYLKNKNYRIH